MTTRRILWLGVFVTMLVYAGSLWYGPVYEDAREAVAWQWGWLTAIGPSRAYSSASLWLVPQVGPGLVAPHLLNLGLHLVNGYLVWRIARTWLPDAAAVWAPVLTWLAPIQTESVAYLAGRSDLMVATGTLLAVAGAVCGWRTPWRVAALIGGTILAVGSKETGLVVIPIIVWTAVSWRLCRRVGLWTWAAVLGVIGVGLILALGRAIQSPGIQVEAIISDQTAIQYAAVQASAWWRYVALIVVPWGLSIDHDFEAVSGFWHNAALVGVVLLAWQAWRSRRHLAGWAIGAALLSISPRFLTRHSEFLHEHHLYLAVCLLSLALASGVARIQRVRID